MELNRKLNPGFQNEVGMFLLGVIRMAMLLGVMGVAGWRDGVGADASAFADAEVTLRVDSLTGDDARVGEERTAPVRTLARALELAGPHLAAGRHVRVVLATGLHRQRGLRWIPERMNERGSLTIEAEHGGVAELRHSSVLNGPWKAEGGGVFSTPWSNQWGFVYLHHEKGGPELDGSKDDPSELVGWYSAAARAEWVVHNGRPLRLSGARTHTGSGKLRAFGDAERVPEGAVFVDDVRGVLLVHLPGGLDPAAYGYGGFKEMLEIAETARSFPSDRFWPGVELEIGNVRNLRLRGLVVSHAWGGIESHAVRIKDAANVLIEDCRFEDNGGCGLGLDRVAKLSVLGSSFVGNGGRGIGAHDIKDARFVGVDARGNNVRGDWAGFRGWSVAGMKVTGQRTARVLVEASSFSGNMASGLWFDFCDGPIELKQLRMDNNLETGLMLEITQGPVTVEQCSMLNNGAIGLFVCNTSGVSAVNNRIAENRGAAQVALWDDNRNTENFGTEQLKRYPEYSADWTLQRNLIAGDGVLVGNQWRGEPDRYARAIGSARFDDNLYITRSTGDAHFEIVRDGQWVRVDWPTWRETTRLDVGSTIRQRP